MQEFTQNLKDFYNRNKKALIVGGAAVVVLTAGIVGGSILLGDHNTSGNQPGSSSVVDNSKKPGESNNSTPNKTSDGRTIENIAKLDSFYPVVPALGVKGFEAVDLKIWASGDTYNIADTSVSFISDDYHNESGANKPACSVSLELLRDDQLTSDTLEEFAQQLIVPGVEGVDRIQGIGDRKVPVKKIDSVVFSAVNKPDMAYRLERVEASDSKGAYVVRLGVAKLTSGAFAVLKSGCIDSHENAADIRPLEAGAMESTEELIKQLQVYSF